MKLPHKNGYALLALAITGCLLCGCSQLIPSRNQTEPAQTAAAETESVTQPTAPIESVTMVVTEDTITELENYPDLKKADLTGSTCYGAIDAYRQRHPEVKVVYMVTVGTQNVLPDMQELALTAADLEQPDNLQYLHSLEVLNLPGDSMTGEQLQVIRALVPNTELRYSVTVGGVTCDPDTQSLNLSQLDSSEVSSAAEKLQLLPKLQQVELMDGSGYSRLSKADVQLLQAVAPQAQFHYSFELFGRTVSTLDTEIVYTNQPIGSQVGSEVTLRQALSILKNCRRFVLDDCQFSNETLAQIREEYRGQTKVVWRVRFARDGSCLTDREMIRSTFNLTSNNCHDLMYCEDVKYLDAGHNEDLYDIDFVAYMPKLVVAIVSGAPISDLTPFANCPKLEFLELGFCGYVKDISPLETCYSLERLNIGFTKVSDISALEDKNMVVLVDTHTGVPNSQRTHFSEVHPDCLVQHSGAQPYGYPWRYHQNMEFHEYYLMLREVFDYENGTNTHF